MYQVILSIFLHNRAGVFLKILQLVVVLT